LQQHGAFIIYAILSSLASHPFVVFLGVGNWRILTQFQPAHKSFRVKRLLGKKMRQNRPIPQWIRLRTGNTIRYFAFDY
jgi:large subunit ribosomal protein L39e